MAGFFSQISQFSLDCSTNQIQFSRLNFPVYFQAVDNFLEYTMYMGSDRPGLGDISTAWWEVAENNFKHGTQLAEEVQISQRVSYTWGGSNPPA